MPEQKLEPRVSSPSDWGYTVRAVDIVEKRQTKERNLGREARPTITRDSPIDGGVYEGAYGGEAIVVDSEKFPALNESLEEVMRRITGENGQPNKNLALSTVYSLVQKRMQYDMHAVNDIFTRVGEGRDGAKIALDTYINQGVGVCRHQALYAGALLEGLAKRGVLSGQVSVERNKIKRNNGDKYDGHSWVRYTNSAGTVYILDVAQGKLDTLENLMRARREGDVEVWDYGRKEDHDRVRAQVALQAAAIAEQQGVSKEHSRAVGSDILEYDENRLIMMPDRISRRHQGQETGASRLIKQGSQHERQVKPENRFWTMHSALVAEIDKAINTADYVDPCMQANRISAKIGDMMRLAGLNPVIAHELAVVQQLCVEIAASGNNRYSQFYRNQRSGLADVRRQIAALSR